MYTIEAFYHAVSSMQIIIVLPHEQITLWKNLCEQYHFSIKHLITEGGDTRFQSVKNGLKYTSSDGIIGVHDGVRPFVSEEVIKRCYAEAERYKAVVPVIDVVESIRELLPDNESKSVMRDNYKLVQTPQVFEASTLLRAYEQRYTSSFTDDASVVETMGTDIHLVQGNRENIKITTPFDLKIADSLLK